MEEWVDERIEEVQDDDLLSRKVDDGCFEPNEVLQAWKCTVENEEAEDASEAMDHVSDTIIQDLTAPASKRGNIASQIFSSLGNGVGGSQSQGLDGSVKGMDDQGVLLDISRAMMSGSTINPVSYNANIPVGQVNDAQVGDSYASCRIEENKVPLFRHLLQVMGLPLVRDDPELDRMFKERVRWGDPMAHLVKKKYPEHVLSDLGDDDKMKESGFIVPQDIPSHSWLKRGLDAAPNRYGIRPGRHWDGVDRSNGFEKEMFKRTNEKQATEREAYLWSVSDM
ncbi:hypothetical protein TEA_002231 [Camellia sinensis var. sinensis]|uniref:Uncharacterized protein n=1 Tax=Camellia sinensis var. sinensis TaxID=542762 RepID=A0A4S4EZB0_CAMSN|nr:hypothetical protein TEA_002231 [Camellia sinensis var. sinensis]